MGKSKGNADAIKTILEKGYSPEHLRYFFLSGHYKKPLNFTWESLDASRNAHEKLKNILHEFKRSREKQNKKNIELAYKQFLDIINDDLNMPRGLSFLWEIIREEKLNNAEKYELILKFDKVFGLDLDKEEKIEIPAGLRELISQREKSRKEKDFKTADKIREKINKLGFIVEDKEKGFAVKKR